MKTDIIKNKLKKQSNLFLGEDRAFRSAVIIPIVEVENEAHILFQVRALNMRKQPGDISFPGGKIDSSDASPFDAAIRETCEELGLHGSAIEVVGELSPFIPSSTFVVYPFIAKVDISQMAINPDEVDHTFTVPLNWLLNHEPYVHQVSLTPMPTVDFPFDKIANGKQYKWRSQMMEEWFYEYGRYTIWGLTGRILKEFLRILKQDENKRMEE